MGMKTFKYRLYPSKAQARRMLQVLDVYRHFYNMCLDERMSAFKLKKRSVKKSEQAKIVFSQSLQTVADDLDKAFKAFFRRVQVGERKPGYPRFKGRYRFHSFAFKRFGVGAKLDGQRLKLFELWSAVRGLT